MLSQLNDCEEFCSGALIAIIEFWALYFRRTCHSLSFYQASLLKKVNPFWEKFKLKIWVKAYFSQENLQRSKAEKLKMWRIKILQIFDPFRNLLFIVYSCRGAQLNV